MKYATLAMVATVAATDAWALTAAHAAACPTVTSTKTTAIHAANVTAVSRKAFLKAAKDLLTSRTTETATAADALAKCWKDTTPPTVTKDQIAPAKATSTCAADWNTW